MKEELCEKEKRKLNQSTSTVVLCMAATTKDYHTKKWQKKKLMMMKPMIPFHGRDFIDFPIPLTKRGKILFMISCTRNNIGITRA